MGCITDQSNWPGPFSQEVVTHALESRGRGVKPQSGYSTGIFYLHICFSSYSFILFLAFLCLKQKEVVKGLCRKPTNSGLVSLRTLFCMPSRGSNDLFSFAGCKIRFACIVQ